MQRYISYPTVEAYKDVGDNFRDHTVLAKKKINYKQMAAESSPYKDPRKICLLDWRDIISGHLKKGNFIVNGEYILPVAPLSQTAIFEGQQMTCINPFGTVAVLSGIPFFIDEYFEELPVSFGE